MLGKSVNNITDLDKLRMLVRQELGFGDKYHSDSENTWLAVVSCKQDS